MDTARIERYLAKADECERLAKQAYDSKVRLTYEDLARQWRYLPRKSENSHRKARPQFQDLREPRELAAQPRGFPVI
jgi:hypothetical protein